MVVSIASLTVPSLFSSLQPHLATTNLGSNNRSSLPSITIHDYTIINNSLTRINNSFQTAFLYCILHSIVLFLLRRRLVAQLADRAPTWSSDFSKPPEATQLAGIQNLDHLLLAFRRHIHTYSNMIRHVFASSDYSAPEPPQG